MGFKDIESRAKALEKKKYQEEQKPEEQENFTEKVDGSES